MPIHFVLSNLFGVDHPNITPRKLDFDGMLTIIPALQRWIAQGVRNIVMEQNAFNVLARALPDVISDQQKRKNLEIILANLASVKSTTESRVKRLLDITLTNEVTCQFNNKAVITLGRHFGLQELKVNGESIRLAFFGIRARSLGGLINPTIDLGRVDVTKDQPIIHDVPVVDTVAIDLHEQNPKVACGVER